MELKILSNLPVDASEVITEIAKKVNIISLPFFSIIYRKCKHVIRPGFLPGYHAILPDTLSFNSLLTTS